MTEHHEVAAYLEGWRRTSSHPRNWYCDKCEPDLDNRPVPKHPTVWRPHNISDSRACGYTWLCDDHMAWWLDTHNE